MIHGLLVLPPTAAFKIIDPIDDGKRKQFSRTGAVSVLLSVA
jgi:hypothetical protein